MTDISEHIEAIKDHISRQYDELCRTNPRVAEMYKSCADITEGIKKLDRLQVRINETEKFIKDQNRILAEIETEFSDWLHREIYLETYTLIDKDDLFYRVNQKVEELLICISEALIKLDAIKAHPDSVLLQKEEKYEAEFDTHRLRLNEDIRLLKALAIDIDEAMSYTRIWKDGLRRKLHI